jgi:hypothetical protein
LIVGFVLSENNSSVCIFSDLFYFFIIDHLITIIILLKK